MDIWGKLDVASDLQNLSEEPPVPTASDPNGEAGALQETGARAADVAAGAFRRQWDHLVLFGSVIDTRPRPNQRHDADNRSEGGRDGKERCGTC